MKIKVDIRVTEKKGYDTLDVAVCALEVEAPWDDVKPTAIHRALDDVLEDVTERIGVQLKAEHKRRIAAATPVEDDLPFPVMS